MKNLALVLATLCIFAQASTVFQAPAFVELKKSPFGSSVAALIEMNMGYTGKLDAIDAALDAVEAELNAQKTSNDDQIASDRSWCASTKATLSEQIHGLENDIYDAEVEKSNLLGEQSTLTGNLAAEKTQLASNQQHLADDRQAIVDEDARYTAAAADYAEAITACEQALNILNTLVVSPAGFIQSKAKFSGVVALLEKHLAKQSSSFVKPVLSVLAELTSSQQVNQSQLSSVIQLINDLLTELRNQQAQNESNHTITINSLNDAIANLETVIAQEEQQIRDWEARLDWIAQRIVALDSQLLVSNNLLGLVRGQWDTTVDQCNGYEAAYSGASADVAEQWATLQALRDYFDNHVVPAVEHVDDAAYSDSVTVF